MVQWSLEILFASFPGNYQSETEQSHNVNIPGLEGIRNSEDRKWIHAGIFPLIKPITLQWSRKHGLGLPIIHNLPGVWKTCSNSKCNTIILQAKPQLRYKHLQWHLVCCFLLSLLRRNPCASILKSYSEVLRGQKCLCQNNVIKFEAWDTDLRPLADYC